mgnify:CR=1 FL=1
MVFLLLIMIFMMKKEEFHKLLECKPLILDGATGSNLQKVGMPRGCCTEQWILEHPKALTDLQADYVEAGSQILYAPTFQAQPAALKTVGLDKQTAAINAMRRDALNLLTAQRARHQEPRLNRPEKLPKYPGVKSHPELTIQVTSRDQITGRMLKMAPAVLYVPVHILAENPEMTANEAITKSKELMNGNRWRLFCLARYKVRSACR